MSKRLQVLLEEDELREIRETADRERMTVAEWVRQALRAARRLRSSGGAETKLAAVRAAAALDFPTADIDVMLREIESGYGSAEPDR